MKIRKKIIKNAEGCECHIIERLTARRTVDFPNFDSIEKHSFLRIYRSPTRVHYYYYRRSSHRTCECTTFTSLCKKKMRRNTKLHGI